MNNRRKNDNRHSPILKLNWKKKYYFKNMTVCTDLIKTKSTSSCFKLFDRTSEKIIARISTNSPQKYPDQQKS